MKKQKADITNQPKPSSTAFSTSTLRHLVLAQSPATASTPSGSDGCIAVPKSIAFAPGKKWKLKKVILKAFGVGAGAAVLATIHVRWQVSVTVECNCGNPPPLTRVKGTRILEKDVQLPFDSEIHLPTNNPLPYDIPTPLTLIDAIVEYIAHKLAEMGTLGVLTPGDVQLIANTIDGDKPTSPGEGEWKDKKDPCRKLKRS